MTKNDAILNRNALLLFNFWLKRQPKNKRVGDLTIGDFIELCRFLIEEEDINENN
jgi:hypothetical protein